MFIIFKSRGGSAALFALAIINLIIPCGSLGQSPPQVTSNVQSDSAALHGVVRDSHNFPLAGVIISLQGQNVFLTTRSDSAGVYGFLSVRPGIYSLHAKVAGFRETTIPDLVVNQQKPKVLDFTLESVEQSVPRKPDAQPAYFDEPNFTVAGVTDTTNLGGHGSDIIVRNRESLAKDAVSLPKPDSESHSDAIAAQHHQLAEMDEKEGKPLDAVREYQRAAELDPSETNLFDWGSELLLHRAAEPAIEVFTEGNRLFPQSARMLTALGTAWYAQGSAPQAAQRLCEASDLNPGDPEPYLFMGKIEDVESLRSEAIAQRLKRFAELQPNNEWANYYYAISLWKQWRSSEDLSQLGPIKALLEKAVQLDPKLGLAWLQLGILDAEQRDFAKAISAYERAIAETPRLEQAHYRLAQAYRESGEVAKARIEVQLYQQIHKEKADEAARQRHEMQQFVYQLPQGSRILPQ